jgi:Tol biopolymer transport system component
LSDDRTVVYRAAAGDGTSSLGSVPLSGGPSRQILSQFVSTTTFRMSPDGRSIAYVSSTDPKNIWVQAIDDGAPRPLTRFTEKDITSFTFSPDGRRLAITRGTSLADIVLIKGFR